MIGPVGGGGGLLFVAELPDFLQEKPAIRNKVAARAAALMVFIQASGFEHNKGGAKYLLYRQSAVQHRVQDQKIFFDSTEIKLDFSKFSSNRISADELPTIARSGALLSTQRWVASSH